VRDWPGFGGPLVHSPDLFSDSSFVEALAASIAPRMRVVSVSPRLGVPYQVNAMDLLGVIEQFGFVAPVVLGEGLGCLVALMLAAWYPSHTGGLILVEPKSELTTGDSTQARALRDCPPDVARLRARVRCPVIEATRIEEITRYLAALP
jgi:pimeloyl-ACP methyl ester carboxylesterase